MNKDALISRLSNIENNIQQNRVLVKQHKSMMDQLHADYNALLGAKQEANFWLNEICEKDSEESEKF